MKEIKETLIEVISYISESYANFKPMVTWLSTLGGWLAWCLFPISAYKGYATVVAIAIVIDTFTRIWAIAYLHGGFINAVKGRHFSSHLFWVGIYRKLVVYLMLIILVGLGARLDILQLVGFGASFVYAAIFLREAYSIFENLQIMGFSEAQWIMNLIKRSENKLNNSQDKDKKSK